MWEEKCLIWLLLRAEFWKAFVLLEISTLKFRKLQKFAKKMPKFVIKGCLFGYL